MKVKIQTEVGASVPDIKIGFTEDLFLSLNPPFPPVKLMQFDGCRAGDKVALELNFILFKQLWVSHIIEDYESDNHWWFIDVGIKLPFFLKSWKHIHDVKQAGQRAVISDQITFSTGWILGDAIMYPFLLLQFLYRKPIYQKVFSR
ncbi:MAG: hypothetical protein ABJG47_06440 [Ekhidna sp.]